MVANMVSAMISSVIAPLTPDAQDKILERLQSEAEHHAPLLAAYCVEPAALRSLLSAPGPIPQVLRKGAQEFIAPSMVVQFQGKESELLLGIRFLNGANRLGLSLLDAILESGLSGLGGLQVIFFSDTIAKLFHLQCGGTLNGKTVSEVEPRIFLPFLRRQVTERLERVRAALVVDIHLLYGGKGLTPEEKEEVVASLIAMLD